MLRAATALVGRSAFAARRLPVVRSAVLFSTTRRAAALDPSVAAALDAAFMPRGIAVVGASSRPGSVGLAVMKNLLRGEYAVSGRGRENGTRCRRRGWMLGARLRCRRGGVSPAPPASPTCAGQYARALFGQPPPLPPTLHPPSQGAIYPVNPRATSVQGIPAYASVRDLAGRDIDLAVVIVKADLVPEVVADAGRCGIKVWWRGSAHPIRSRSHA